MIEPIPYTKPSITDLEIRYTSDAMTQGWGARCYDYIVRFEKSFQDHLQVPHAIATSSCTGAMTLGLAALGIQAGDEVILADTNWIATVAPVVHMGAKPIFVDIDPQTWCIDPVQVFRAITPKTKAIIATHLYGNLCNMEALLKISQEHQIPIIEDAAEAIGSVYHGRRAGSLGTFGVFSFHGTKTMTTGEGGMFVCQNPELYEKALTLSNHGRAKSQTKQFWPDMVGYKFKMSNVQAAMGCAQVERIAELIERKRQIFDYYQQALTGVPGIQMNGESPACEIGAWMPNVVFHRDLKIEFAQIEPVFKQAQIDARPFFHPLSSLDFFSKCLQNHHAYDIAPRALNLPSFHDITEAQQTRVIELIHQLVQVHNG